MFQQFREGKITYDQLLARVEGRRSGKPYIVLDDLKGVVEESILKVEKEDGLLLKAAKLKETQERDKGEAIDWPHSKKCVHTLFTQPQKKPHFPAKDLLMLERHKNEVLEKKEQLEMSKREIYEERYNKTQARIAEVREKKAKSKADAVLLTKEQKKEERAREYQKVLKA